MTDNDKGLDPEKQDPAAPVTGNDSEESEGGTFSADYVKSLRNEAADWRRKLREAEAKLDEINAREASRAEKELAEQSRWKELAEKRQAELEKLQTDMAQQRLEAMRLRVGNELGLPNELVARLNGATEEEIRADAEVLAQILPQQPRRQSTTSAVPGGQPAGETDEQRRQRIFHNKRDVFSRR